MHRCQEGGAGARRQRERERADYPLQRGLPGRGARALCMWTAPYERVVGHPQRVLGSFGCRRLIVCREREREREREFSVCGLSGCGFSVLGLGDALGLRTLRMRTLRASTQFSDSRLAESQDADSPCFDSVLGFSVCGLAAKRIRWGERALTSHITTTTTIINIVVITF